MSKIEELKTEADELGIKYSEKIGEETLAKRIEEAYKAKEVPVKIKEQEAGDTGININDPEMKFRLKIKEAEKEARKTKIVTITDNDPKENMYTTVASVTCGNEYFDLGTALLPLNEPIEVTVGHLGVLESLLMQVTVRNQNTGLDNTVLRKRYSIQYHSELAKIK